MTLSRSRRRKKYSVGITRGSRGCVGQDVSHLGLRSAFACRYDTNRRAGPVRAASGLRGHRRWPDGGARRPGRIRRLVVPSESRFPERVRRPSRRRPGRPLDSPSRGRGPVAGATLVDVLLPIVHARMGSSENTQTPLRFWRRRASCSSTTVAPRPDGGRPPRVRSHRRCVPRRFSPLVRRNPVDRAPDRAPSGEIVWPPVWRLTLCAAVGE